MTVQRFGQILSDNEDVEYDTVARDVVFDGIKVTSSQSTAYVSGSTTITSPAGGITCWLANEATAAGAQALWQFDVIAGDGSHGYGYFGYVSAATGVVPVFVVGRRSGSKAYTETMRIDENGNLLLNKSAAPASATRTVVIKTGIAPTSSPVDAVTLYSADISIGNAALHVRTERGKIVKVYQAMNHLADPTDLPTALTAIATIIDGLKKLGVMAPDP